MEFIEQKHKRTCGHIAVAHVTGAPLAAVMEIIKHKHGTKTKELISAIRALGFICSDSMKRSWAWTNGIAQLREPNKSGWHWVAVVDGIVYDGNRSGPMPLEEYRSYQLKAYNRKITSFLPVYRGGAA